MSPAGATPGPIAPHGGALVERFDDSLDEGGGRPRVTLTARQQADLDLIAVGALSPLDGFMGREAYEAVVEDMRLPSGLAWSVPVTLGVAPGRAGAASAPPTRSSSWTRAGASSACSR